MKIRYVLYTVLFPIAVEAQVPVLEWGHAFTGVGNTVNYINTCRDVETDPDGNVYTIGEFANNLDLDPGIGSATVNSAGQTDFDMFLACYDSTGAYLWKQQIETASIGISDQLERMPGGDLVIGGYFNGDMDMDPGLGTATITGATELYFARYTAVGEYVWAKHFGSVSGVDEMHDMEVDAQGNIWIVGTFNDTLDLDPDPGVAQFLCTPASSDGFMAKYDADGNFQWGHTIGNNWGDRIKTIAFDASGNAIVAGYFRISIDVEPGPGVTTITQVGTGDDAFVATYSTTGALIGHYSFGGMASIMDPAASAVDASGNLLLCGELYGDAASLTPGQTNGTINAGSETYGWLAKYSASGALIWSDVFTSTGSVGPNFNELGLDSDGDIHLLGSHTYTFDVDPGPGNVQFSAISDDGYLLKYAGTDGALIQNVHIGGGGAQHIEGLHIDAADHVYVAGGGYAAFPFNGSVIGGGNNAILMKTGECLPPEILAPIQVATQVCESDYVPMSLSATGTALHYEWYLDGEPFGTDDPMVVTGPIGVGPHEFQCIVTNACGSDTSATATTDAFVWPDPVIIEVSGTLICQGTGVTYTWYLNGQAIAGANSSSYVPVVNGTYTVNVSTLPLCSETSPPHYYGGSGIIGNRSQAIGLFQTPGTGSALLVGTSAGATLRVFDLTGHMVLSLRTTGTTMPIDLTDRAQGIYLLATEGQVFRLVR